MTNMTVVWVVVGLVFGVFTYYVLTNYVALKQETKSLVAALPRTKEKTKKSTSSTVKGSEESLKTSKSSLRSQIRQAAELASIQEGQPLSNVSNTGSLPKLAVPQASTRQGRHDRIRRWSIDAAQYAQEARDPTKAIRLSQNNLNSSQSLSLYAGPNKPKKAHQSNPSIKSCLKVTSNDKVFEPAYFSPSISLGSKSGVNKSQSSSTESKLSVRFHLTREQKQQARRSGSPGPLMKEPPLQKPLETHTPTDAPNDTPTD